jgi:hypothetical protein
MNVGKLYISQLIDLVRILQAIELKEISGQSESWYIICFNNNNLSGLANNINVVTGHDFFFTFV